jgi:hypothetical protein
VDLDGLSADDDLDNDNNDDDDDDDDDWGGFQEATSDAKMAAT